MDRKTFILGVGAQKAGTTWLHKYLSRLDQFDAGFCKEYHIWDALTLNECKKFRVPRNKQFAPNGNRQYRLGMQANVENYFSYFSNLLQKDGVQIVGDVTPSYAGLSADTMRNIKDGFTKLSIDCKSILLIRDPIERCWSAVRFHRKRGRATEGVRLDLNEEDSLLCYAHSSDALFRTDYAKTVANLYDSFPEEDVYVGVYETMFNETSVSALSEFLGVPAQFELAQKRFNVSPKNEGISEECQAKIAEIFKSTYQYCQQAFPQTREYWTGYKYLNL